ncbi:MAG: hypothetical protein HKN28_02685 [Alphaproteobacteria bacterium]|nr:hypothetical protein [Alphaproteobacteria bacterium]
MAMDRQTLGRTLDAGRTSTLNCFATTADIAAMSAKVRDNDEIGPLFRNKYLNNCIVLKIIALVRQDRRRTFNTDTLLYFPYNASNIYEGGDSVLFSDAKREAMLRHKCGFDPNDPAQRDDIEHDNHLLEMLADIPTLDPFLLREKAMQMDVAGEINPVYFNLTQEEWSTFQAPIREKIDALVRKALGVTHSLETSDIAEHVTNFLDKIWEARDIENIEAFVDSMEIPRDRAPELFFAWKAICYYQAQSRTLEPSLKKLFQWIGNPRTALPIDLMTLREELRDQIDAEISLLKQRMREYYKETQSILDIYEDSYLQFIEKGNPEPFKRFLGDAQEQFLALAACLSANAHAINLLEDQIRRGGAQVYAVQHRELLDCLLTIYGIDRAEALAAIA